MELNEIIAKDVMVSDVVSVAPTDRIGAVDLMMIRSAIGGVPVVNKSNQLLGIITQRDIMLSRFTASISSSKVEDLMTQNVISCDIDCSLKNLLDRMLKNNVERLPVTDENNKLIGLVVHQNILQKIHEVLK